MQWMGRIFSYFELELKWDIFWNFQTHCKKIFRKEKFRSSEDYCMQSFIIIGLFRFRAKKGDKTTIEIEHFNPLNHKCFYNRCFKNNNILVQCAIWGLFSVNLPRNDCLKRPKLRLWPLLLLWYASVSTLPFCHFAKLWLSSKRSILVPLKCHRYCHPLR